MKRLLGLLISCAVLSSWAGAGDFAALDAASHVLYDIDSSTGRVLAVRKLIVPPGVTLGAMDYGYPDPYSGRTLLVCGAPGPTNFDVYTIYEQIGVIYKTHDVFFGLGNGQAGLALDHTTWILSSTPTGAILEWMYSYGSNYSHVPMLTGSISGQDAFGVAADAPFLDPYFVLRDASSSRLAQVVGTGPLDQSIIGTIVGPDDSLGFSLQEHPTPGLLSLFSPADEALYTIDITSAVTTLVAPLPGSSTLTSIAPRDRSTVEFCFGQGELEPGCGACPCSNEALSGTSGGCANSAQLSARLWPSGSVSSSADTLRFQVTDLPPSSFAILIAGQSALPVQGSCPLGSGTLSSSLDGIRCVGNGVVRLGTRSADAAGEIGLGNPGWGVQDGPAGGLGASAGISTGQTRYFQAFYRDDPTFGCGSGLHTTQAVAVTGE